MTWEPIRKVAPPGACFNLADYARSVRDFSWKTARAELDGLPSGQGLNIAHEAVDRHAAGPRAAVAALRCIARDGQVTEFSYADLRSATNRFANLLRGLGGS
jgi:acetyl-CoA synthetase